MQRTLTFAPQYAGTNGQPVTFEVANELVPTTAPGPYTLNLHTDNPIVNLKATQGGTAGEASFTHNWLSACGNSTIPPVTTPSPGSGFSIAGVMTMNCAVVAGGERSLTFTPQYAGTNGRPISFAVVNESLPTTAMGPYTLRVYADNPTITLKATQDGTAGEASFTHNWLAACNNAGARKGVELMAPLQVRVLGNPVRDVLMVEVTGAQGQALTVLLTDMQSRVAGQSQTETANAVEPYRFNVSGQPGGMYLLRVTAGGRTKTVRVVKVK